MLKNPLALCVKNFDGGMSPMQSTSRFSGGAHPLAQHFGIRSEDAQEPSPLFVLPLKTSGEF